MSFHASAHSSTWKRIISTPTDTRPLPSVPGDAACLNADTEPNSRTKRLNAPCVSSGANRTEQSSRVASTWSGG